MATSTHVCEVSSGEMDPTTRGAGVRPKAGCLQNMALQARARLLERDPDAPLNSGGPASAMPAPWPKRQKSAFASANKHEWLHF
jgi:hypothetical protein